MTKLLEQAMAEVNKLPDAEQDAIAALILEEIRGQLPLTLVRGLLKDD